MRWLWGAAGIAAVLAASGSVGAVAGVIYKNPGETNQIGFAPCCGLAPGGVVSGAFGVGNTITFARASNDLTTVDLFGYAGGGSKPIEVDIYAGSNPNTGALLGSAQVIPAGDGYTTEVLKFNQLQLPQTVTFIVSIVGNSGSWDDSFVNWQQFTGAAGSPTVGTAGDMWYGSPGNFVVDDSYASATGAGTNTLAVEFDTPEPATWVMLGFGFAGLGFAGWRKSRTPRSIGGDSIGGDT
jgi:hypothetical protein